MKAKLSGYEFVELLGHSLTTITAIYSPVALVALRKKTSSWIMVAYGIWTF
jgi:hypothetical protein